MSPDQLCPTLKRASEHPGSVPVDVGVARREIVMPPSVDLDLVRRFGLSVAKAVLNGRGDRVIDLEKTHILC